MAKIQLKDEKITAFGGIVHVNEFLGGDKLLSIKQRYKEEKEYRGLPTQNVIAPPKKKTSHSE